MEKVPKNIVLGYNYGLMPLQYVQERSKYYRNAHELVRANIETINRVYGSLAPAVLGLIEQLFLRKPESQAYFLETFNLIHRGLFDHRLGTVLQQTVVDDTSVFLPPTVYREPVRPMRHYKGGEIDWYDSLYEGQHFVMAGGTLGKPGKKDPGDRSGVFQNKEGSVVAVVADGVTPNANMKRNPLGQVDWHAANAVVRATEVALHYSGAQVDNSFFSERFAGAISRRVREELAERFPDFQLPQPTRDEFYGIPETLGEATLADLWTRATGAWWVKPQERYPSSRRHDENGEVYVAGDAGAFVLMADGSVATINAKSPRRDSLRDVVFGVAKDLVPDETLTATHLNASYANKKEQMGLVTVSPYERQVLGKSILPSLDVPDDAIALIIATDGLELELPELVTFSALLPFVYDHPRSPLDWRIHEYLRYFAQHPYGVSRFGMQLARRVTLQAPNRWERPGGAAADDATYVAIVLKDGVSSNDWYLNGRLLRAFENAQQKVLSLLEERKLVEPVKAHLQRLGSSINEATREVLADLQQQQLVGFFQEIAALSEYYPFAALSLILDAEFQYYR